ncbi:hypothetical protein CBS101457_006157 [Exobasidium rhododendri]|nr:hypothetical protein CBS101457_006157 [Exobasidium rhododendri]
MTVADKFKEMTSSPNGQKATGLYKKAETGLWKVLDPIGKMSNNLAGKMGAEAFWPSELSEGELDKAARILRTFTITGAQADDDPHALSSGGVIGGAPKTEAEVKQSKDKYESRKTQKVIKKIPAKALQDCYGVAIFTCFRTGFGFSGAGGSGVVIAKLPDGSWGPPSGILIHTLGWGFLIGLDIYDVVLVLRKPKALKAFENPKISIGGELSIAAGPVGNGAVLDSGIDASPCWSYTKSKGAYAGVQLDGTIILKRDDANARFYGRKVSVTDIFEGKVIVPSAATPLLQTLYAAEGRPEVMGTQHIPEGLAPGDVVITPEEAKEMEARSNHDGSHTTQPASFSQQSLADQSGTHTARASAHRVPPPPPPAYEKSTASAYPPEK